MPRKERTLAFSQVAIAAFAAVVVLAIMSHVGSAATTRKVVLADNTTVVETTYIVAALSDRGLFGSQSGLWMLGRGRGDQRGRFAISLVNGRRGAIAMLSTKHFVHAVRALLSIHLPFTLYSLGHPCPVTGYSDVSLSSCFVRRPDRSVLIILSLPLPSNLPIQSLMHVVDETRL